jgi:hypothetical protein
LKKDEYVVAVGGRLGLIVDQLKFVTNKGRTFTVGGQGGNEFSHELPHGYHMGAISAAKMTYLQGFQFDYKRIPVSKHKNQPQPFVFFESVEYFNYAI